MKRIPITRIRELAEAAGGRGGIFLAFDVQALRSTPGSTDTRMQECDLSTSADPRGPVITLTRRRDDGKAWETRRPGTGPR